MTRIVSWLFVVGISFSTCASAEFDIKGVKIGMTREELIAAHPGLNCDVACFHAETPSRRVKTLETLAGARVSAWWFKFSPDGKLKSSNVTLGASSGPVVTSAFIEKFGKPTTAETSEFRTAGGYSGPKQETTWVDGDTVIMVAHPYSKIIEMKVEIYSKTQRDADVEAFRAKSKKDL